MTSDSQNFDEVISGPRVGEITNNKKTQRDPKDDRLVDNFEKDLIKEEFLTRNEFSTNFLLEFYLNPFWEKRHAFCIPRNIPIGAFGAQFLIFQPRETYKSDFCIL